MRPIDRGDAPQVFVDYSEAKPFLARRFGTYCSFCERRIPTNLAVEHILPKDEDLPYAHLRNEWTNFLLSCVNCNSTKGRKIVNFATFLLPDRDNTFIGFNYLDTGVVEATGATQPIQQMAQRTLDLVGLNTVNDPAQDETLLFAALKRSGQRLEAFKIATEAREDFENGETNIRTMVNLAMAHGFFSIWMKVFEGIAEVRLALINAFSNTAVDCFDANGNAVTPRPNIPALQNSGKV